MFLMTLLAITMPFPAFWSPQHVYELRFSIPKISGEPFSAMIVIGLEEFEGRFGWHYGIRNTDIYAGCGYDIEATDTACKRIIGDMQQHVLPYYIAMFPMAGIGYQQFFLRLSEI